MIDLHMHTTYSDGSDGVKELLEKAERLQLHTISITDHNTCKAYEELKENHIRNLFSGRMIPGVELNTKVWNIPIEILGYHVDTESLQAQLEKVYITKEERNKIEVQRMYEKCRQEGIALPEDFVEQFDGSVYASKYFHHCLTKEKSNQKFLSKASWENSNIFYREYMSNPTSKFFIDIQDIVPDFEQASNLIHQAGGLVFIPHIFEYRENAKPILQYILEHYTFDGIECYYRNFSKEQTQYLLNICQDRKLYVSGGSDYHGKNKRGVEMGTGEGNLCVPDEIIEDWKNKKRN